jgi:ring-1,2-phenylacetyl-CoA epoxidase subunit PaaC
MWRFTAEMFELPETTALRANWDSRIDRVLAESGLTRPADTFQRRGGRQGIHTEHLGHLLAEMQSVARAHPGASW